MKDKLTELIIINSFFLFASVLLFFLDYDILASALIILIFLTNMLITF